ncbi:MAG: exlusion protein FxsA [Rhodobacter sp.]|nr:exlusion protein FxsA [Rhodobacter sp.]
MWIFLAILAIPLIEIGLFVQLGGAIGLWPTLAWVLVSAGLGIIVLKGVATLGPVSLSRDMHELSDPQSPLAHRVMVVLGGGLLLLPGFFTDAIGLLLLVPPIRLLAIKWIGRRLQVKAKYAARSQVIEGEWQEANPETPSNPDAKPSDWTKH